MLVDIGLADSRRQARTWIMSGEVLVHQVPVTKPGTQIPADSPITVRAKPIAYVSRGGLKLEAALNSYALSVNGLICLDVGASTGGFTDCLLQKGAGHVYAVDVGYGQLAWKLRQDPRVTAIERTNIRYMKETVIPEPIDLAAIDTSFISLKIVIPSVLKFLKPNGMLLALIKPQFEVGKGKVGKGGIVREEFMRAEVLKDLSIFFNKIGLFFKPPIPSPILGSKGNMEYLILLSSKEFAE